MSAEMTERLMPSLGTNQFRNMFEPMAVEERSRKTVQKQSGYPRGLGTQEPCGLKPNGALCSGRAVLFQKIRGQGNKPGIR